MMLRVLTSIFFILHGLVHLLWLGSYWKLMEVDGIPYTTRVLAGRINVGDTGIRIVGILWAIATLAWVIAGLGLVFTASWWQAMTIGAALFSSVMCVLGLPVAKFGLLINIATLTVVFLNGQYNWLP
jgi:hypothetical protein